jgi:CheY-like chemotaxis protein
MRREEPDVLLVANDPRIRELVDAALGPEGYRVVAADGARDAWRLLHHVRSLPRLILLGVEMIDLEGWTLVERVLGDPTLDGIPIVTLGEHLPNSEPELRTMVAVYCR